MIGRLRGIRTLMTLLGVITMAACGGGRTETPAFVDPNPPPEEPLIVNVPEPGVYRGRFVYAETSGPRTFNHMMANETSSTDITNYLFMGLTTFDNEKQEIVPGVAKSWAVSADNLTWTFQLRRGARFSDGHDITAADVLFGFEVAYDPTLHPSVQDLLIMDGKKWDVTAPDPYTIVVKTPSPNAMVPTIAGDVRVMPKHILEPVFRSGGFASAYNVSTPPDGIVTSGPFRVKEYVAGEKTVLTRNPYWFGFDQKNQRLPYLDEMVYLVVPDQDAADLKFRSGEVDALTNVKPENYAWYEENEESGNYTLYDLGPALRTNFFWFNLNKVRKPTPGKRIGEPQVPSLKYAWFNNADFRKAVSMAVDRDAMIQSVFFGDAVKNWSTSTAGSKVWHSADVVKYDFNPEASKKLLAGLKWTDRNGDGFLEDPAGNTIEFSLKTNSDNRMRVSMANFIKDDLAKVGIRVTLVPLDFNTLITNLREDFQYEAILLGLQSGVPPDPGMGQNVWRSSGRTHYWNTEQPRPETPAEARIDQLMDVIVGKPDLAARQAAWKEAQDIVNENAWVIWLPTISEKLPVRNRFGNVQPSSIPNQLIWNIDRVFVKPRGR